MYYEICELSTKIFIHQNGSFGKFSQSIILNYSFPFFNNLVMKNLLKSQKLFKFLWPSTENLHFLLLHFFFQKCNFK